MANLLEGKTIAEQIKSSLSGAIGALRTKPVLASVLATDNAGACTYVKSQKKTAEEVGIEYRLFELDPNVSEQEICTLVKNLNQDTSVNGIIVQMPLPHGVNHRRVLEVIDPAKDVEARNPCNLGKLIVSSAVYIPCTAASVMTILEHAHVDLAGKDVVIVGHSEIVGKPLALMLMNKLATVSVCHIGTSNAGKLEEYVRKGEILIVAVGKAGLIKGEWIKPGAVVIDVGINRVGEKIVGDVEFEQASKRAGYITPVPGGVGPLTVMMLMRNVALSAGAFV